MGIFMLNSQAIMMEEAYHYYTQKLALCSVGLEKTEREEYKYSAVYTGNECMRSIILTDLLVGGKIILIEFSIKTDNDRILFLLHMHDRIPEGGEPIILNFNGLKGKLYDSSYNDDDEDGFHDGSVFIEFNTNDQ